MKRILVLFLMGCGFCIGCGSSENPISGAELQAYLNDFVRIEGVHFVGKTGLATFPTQIWTSLEFSGEMTNVGSQNIETTFVLVVTLFDKTEALYDVDSQRFTALTAGETQTFLIAPFGLRSDPEPSDPTYFDPTDPTSSEVSSSSPFPLRYEIKIEVP